LIILIKLTMQGTKMKVKVNNSYSEWFETKTGVRQGDPLSALFSNNPFRNPRKYNYKIKRDLRLRR